MNCNNTSRDLGIILTPMWSSKIKDKNSKDISNVQDLKVILSKCRWLNILIKTKINGKYEGHEFIVYYVNNKIIVYDSYCRVHGIEARMFSYTKFLENIIFLFSNSVQETSCAYNELFNVNLSKIELLSIRCNILL